MPDVSLIMSSNETTSQKIAAAMRAIDCTGAHIQ